MLCQMGNTTHDIANGCLLAAAVWLSAAGAAMMLVGLFDDSVRSRELGWCSFLPQRHSLAGSKWE